MKFSNTDIKLIHEDISRVEMELGLRLPKTLSDHYLVANGGQPDLYVYEDSNIDTVVNDVLPLISSERGTAVKAYKDFVLNKQIVPKSFFPFAVDGGGDYFFVDCSSPKGDVYFFRGDYWYSQREKCLLNLNVGFEDFWQRLKSEK